MHRQGTRNSYGSDMWRPPGTSTCNTEGASAGGECVPQSGMGVSGGRTITCWWKGWGSSSHSRASWWHSRTMRSGPSGTHTSMARASGTHAWVKTGPAEQAGVSWHRHPPRTPPKPFRLTWRLSDDQMAAAEGQAPVWDGAEGDQDLPAALCREAVELHLPLQEAGGQWGHSGHCRPPAPPPTPHSPLSCSTPGVAAKPAASQPDWSPAPGR